MIQETLATPRINIRDLVVPEPARASSLPFDPERDITTEDWTMMREYVHHCMANRRESDAVELAAYMHLLRHNSPSEQNVLSPNEVEEIQSTLWSFREEFLKILFPSYESRIPIRVQPENVVDAYFPLVFKVFILSPDQLSPLRQSPYAYESRQSYLEEFKADDTGTGYLIREVTAFKLLFPDKTDQIDLSPHRWEILRSFLDKERSYGGERFTEVAALLKILAADRVKMTSEGVKFTMPGSLYVPEKQSPLPEVRRF